jgi:hypothetical protein
MIFYFLAVAAIQSYLAYRAFGLFRTSKHWYPLPMLIVICGIVYDNLVIGLGSFIGEGEMLKSLNIMRFVIHAIFTPMIMIFAFGVAKRIGFRFAQSKVAHSIVCLVVLGLIAFGFYEDVIKSTFIAVSENGLLRYKPEQSMPPIPAITTIIWTMVIGALAWWKTRSPFFFIGPFLFFLMAPFTPKFLWIGNLGEVLMNIGLISGEKNAQKGENV